MKSNDEPSDPNFGDGLRRIRTVIDFFQPLDGKKSIERTMALLHPDVQVMGAPGIGPGRGV